jgi:hypothetical protein
MWCGEVSMFGAEQPPDGVCRAVWCVWCVWEQEELLKKRGEALVRRGRQVIEDMRQRQTELHARMDVLLGARFRAEMDAVQVPAALPSLPSCACSSPTPTLPAALPHLPSQGTAPPPLNLRRVPCMPLGPCTRAYAQNVRRAQASNGMQALSKQIKTCVESGDRLHHELKLCVSDFVRDEDSLTYAILPKVCFRTCRCRADAGCCACHACLKPSRWRGKEGQARREAGGRLERAGEQACSGVCLASASALSMLHTLCTCA